MPEACDAQNSTPLHLAAYRGFTDLVRTLVKDCKVDVDAVNANFVTPLRCAVRGGHENTVRVLIEEFGARLDVLSRSSRPILQHASSYNRYSWRSTGWQWTLKMSGVGPHAILQENSMARIVRYISS